MPGNLPDSVQFAGGARIPRMTNEERWIVQGRAREALREAKRNLATLRVEIEEHAKRLEEGAGCLRHFLSASPGPGPTGMTPRQYATHFFGSLIPENVAQLLKEYEAELERASDLESKVRSFDP
jgi:hypothetical protein